MTFSAQRRQLGHSHISHDSQHLDYQRDLAYWILLGPVGAQYLIAFWGLYFSGGSSTFRHAQLSVLTLHVARLRKVSFWGHFDHVVWHFPKALPKSDFVHVWETQKSKKSAVTLRSKHDGL